MTEQEAVQALLSLDDRDREKFHMDADDILIQFLTENGHVTVASAYLKLKQGRGFWYA